MKILIIEDDEELAAMIARQLTGVGGEVIRVRTISEGMGKLDELRVSPADIITLDLNLPDSHAEETLEKALPEIRAKSQNSIIIVLTGVRGSEDRDRAINLGADDFMVKTPELFTSKGGFVGRLRDILMGLIRQPVRYQKNAELLSNLANRLAAGFTEENAVAKRKREGYFPEDDSYNPQPIGGA